MSFELVLVFFFSANQKSNYVFNPFHTNPFFIPYKVGLDMALEGDAQDSFYQNYRQF
jgi:hypothetical protein